MTKLNEVEKAYIEKYKDEKELKELVKEIDRKGVGPTTVKKYLLYLADAKQTENSTEQENTQEDIKSQETSTTIKNIEDGKFDITDLAAKHERGGVMIMTEGLSELLDDVSKKSNVIDYRGKMAKIKKDKPGPKNVLMDE